MSLRNRVSCFPVLLATLLLPAFFATSSAAQQPAGARKSLTVERIYSQPGLGGRLTRGLAWTPAGKELSYFETKGSGKEAKTELWEMDAASGARRLLVSSATLADPKMSADGRNVSFVRDHNVWLVNRADGKEHAITQGGTEEVRKGELDWVYPEELDIKTAYWWSPDSSAIAYLEMDERKVSQYPMVDFSSPSGEAEMERYPAAGGANPIVRVFVASLNGGEPRAMDTGAETDIYIPRVNWLTDSKQLAIQRLNRTQTALDLLIADTVTGKTRTALSENDPNWINVS